ADRHGDRRRGGDPQRRAMVRSGGSRIGWRGDCLGLANTAHAAGTAAAGVARESVGNARAEVRRRAGETGGAGAAGQVRVLARSVETTGTKQEIDGVAVRRRAVTVLRAGRPPTAGLTGRAGDFKMLRRAKADSRELGIAH